MLKTVRSFGSFNKRRYSNPWIAMVGKDARLDFSKKCGGYTAATTRARLENCSVTDTRRRTSIWLRPERLPRKRKLHDPMSSTEMASLLRSKNATLYERSMKYELSN